jgi:RNA polymerase sigma factor (sigma-70 family)
LRSVHDEAIAWSAENPDLKLVRRGLGGLPGAQRVLAERLLGAVRREVEWTLRRIAPAHGRDPGQDVADLVQDVIVALLDSDGRELRRWSPARGRSLDSFVGLIARRRARRILGGKRRSPWAEPPIEPQRVDARAHRGEASAEQRHELPRLQGRDRTLFELLVVGEHDPHVVARRVGMSRGAVNAWAYRMRKLARSECGASSLVV